MNLKEFFDSEFKDFSNLDNVRSIPSVVDGFKDSQRKAIYGMVQNGNHEIKVAQAAGKVALLTHFAHGETSMADTIVGLAQNFPGSNNINLLEPIGQFGSILSSESSSHRYIFTKPSANIQKFIRPEDDCILEHRYEDGDKVEPLQYYPILPMWIVNGSVGIGTGHSVKILPRDPKKVKKVILDIIHNRKGQSSLKTALRPHFVGWKGKVEDGDEDGKFELVGMLEKVNTTTIRVTELPVTYGVDKFKSILVDLMDKGKVKDFSNDSTETGFDFEIKVPRDVGYLSEEQLVALFKLRIRLTENVTLWDSKGKLRKYDGVYNALEEFVLVRLSAFEARRMKQIDILEEENRFLKNKKLFILEWNSLPNPGKMKASDIEEHMVRKGVDADLIARLMQLRLSSLTMEMIAELEDDITKKRRRISELRSTTSTDMYKEELGAL